jgi:hypothetical protein
MAIFLQNQALCLNYGAYEDTQGVKKSQTTILTTLKTGSERNPNVIPLFVRNKISKSFDVSTKVDFFNKV